MHTTSVTSVLLLSYSRYKMPVMRRWCCRITINSRTLLIDGHIVLTCVSWNDQFEEVVNESVVATANQSSPVSATTMPAPPTSRWQQMVVMTFINGCRPRYSCVQLVKRAPSVLHYRFSQTEVNRQLRRNS